MKLRNSAEQYPLKLLYDARLRPERDPLGVSLTALQHVFRGLSDAASFSSPQFATIGHTLPNCGEEVASWNQLLLARASAADSPQRHGELCNPPIAASSSVDDFLRCGTPPEQHGAMKNARRLVPAGFCSGLVPLRSPQNPSSSRKRLDRAFAPCYRGSSSAPENIDRVSCYGRRSAHATIRRFLFSPVIA